MDPRNFDDVHGRPSYKATKATNGDKAKMKEEDKNEEQHDVDREDLKKNACSSSKTLGSLIYYMIPIPFLILGCIAYGFSTGECQKLCRTEIGKLRNDFQAQSNATWKVAELLASGKGVKTVILLYNPTDEKTAKCLSKSLAKAVSAALACVNNSAEKEPVFLNPEDFSKSEDYGDILVRYSGKMSGAFVLYDLNEIKEEAAKALHDLCEEVNVKEPPRVIMGLLKIKNAISKEPTAASNAARKILTGAWGGLKFSILDPLLSRVVRYTIEVQSEENIPCTN